MIVMASVLVLACAVSLDGFGVGITYGLRRIRIPIVSVLIIALCSGIIIWLSMKAGDWLSGFLPEFAAKLIGSALLIVIGCWALFQLRSGKDVKRSESEEKASVSNPGQLGDAGNAPLVMMLELKRLGLVIQILRTPQAADVDRSGTISASEAIMLGVALSLDAFGAGLGAAMLGLPALPTALTIAVCSGIFLLFGVSIGYRFSSWSGMRVLSFVPGILLVVMGIMKLL